MPNKTARKVPYDLVLTFLNKSVSDVFACSDRTQATDNLDMVWDNIDNGQIGGYVAIDHGDCTSIVCVNYLVRATIRPHVEESK